MCYGVPGSCHRLVYTAVDGCHPAGFDQYGSGRVLRCRTTSQRRTQSITRRPRRGPCCVATDFYFIRRLFKVGFVFTSQRRTQNIIKHRGRPCCVATDFSFIASSVVSSKFTSQRCTQNIINIVVSHVALPLISTSSLHLSSLQILPLNVALKTLSNVIVGNIVLLLIFSSFVVSSKLILCFLPLNVALH